MDGRMNGDEDEDAAESGGREAGGGGGGNVTEMEIMENFVRSLVEGWRYQGRRWRSCLQYSCQTAFFSG